MARRRVDFPRGNQSIELAPGRCGTIDSRHIAQRLLKTRQARAALLYCRLIWCERPRYRSPRLCDRNLSAIWSKLYLSGGARARAECQPSHEYHNRDGQPEESTSGHLKAIVPVGRWPSRPIRTGVAPAICASDQSERWPVRTAMLFLARLSSSAGSLSMSRDRSSRPPHTPDPEPPATRSRRADRCSGPEGSCRFCRDG